jgi:hypothetical protein
VLLYLRHGVEFFLTIERVLWIAAVLAEAVVVARLFREGLLGKYPLFAMFLTAEVLCNVALMQVDVKSRSYAEAYRFGMLFMTVFRLGVAVELYERICKHFPGIGWFRAGMAAILALLAGLAAAFTFRPNLVDQWAFPQTTMVVVLRFQGEIFAAVLVLTWVFLHFVLSIRQPFRPNVLTHWSIATIYFGASGAASLAGLITGGGTAVFPINCALLAVDLGCYFAWFRLMRRSGEELPAFQRLSPDQVRAVEQYNRELLHTVTSLPGEISAQPAKNRDTPLRRVWQR